MSANNFEGVQCRLRLRGPGDGRRRTVLFSSGGGSRVRVNIRDRGDRGVVLRSNGDNSARALSFVSRKHLLRIRRFACSQAIKRATSVGIVSGILCRTMNISCGGGYCLTGPGGRGRAVGDFS